MVAVVTLPKLGLERGAATIVDWHKSEGDWVSSGDVVCTAESEKTTFELQAPADGFIHILVGGQTEVTVGARLALLAPCRDEYERLCRTPDETPEGLSPHSHLTSMADTASVVSANDPAPVSAGVISAQISPAARRIAAELGVDPTALRGSGPDGAVLRGDVLRAAQARGAIAGESGASSAGHHRQAHVEGLSGLRKTIARRMMESLQTTAQMTAFERADATALREATAHYREHAGSLGVRVTPTDLLAVILGLLLREMPIFNASLIHEEIHYWSDVNLGLAVATDDGLVVPVIRAVDGLDVLEIAGRRRDLVEKARGRRLRPSDVDDGTFTLTNFGTYGGDFETPIIYPGQSAILGVGEIRDEVIAVNGSVGIRPAMGFSLTVDHRLIDGAVAGRFRKRFKALVERIDYTCCRSTGK